MPTEFLIKARHGGLLAYKIKHACIYVMTASPEIYMQVKRPGEFPLIEHAHSEIQHTCTLIATHY